ncbi:MAG TPA: sulfite exporter TauE/SafE family protein [Rhodoblastus sp.]|nr:sulfite exporter TauE/SafE family protein [Rhodoblastus sp.]
MMIDPLYSLSGAVVGLIVGLTGVGGGSLMTPLLVLLFGVHPATAVGTDLLYAAVTKGAGTFAHGSRQNVDWRVVRLLAAGSVPASAATLLAMSWSGANSADTTKLIGAALGVALLLTALSILFRPWLLKIRGDRPPMPQRRLDWTTFAVGLTLGVLVSASSVGAGALGVTALLMLYPATPVVRIIGTDIAHAVPLTFVAGAGHWLIGSVDLHMLLSLLLGSIPGIVIGSRLAPRVHERFLRMLLAAVLAIVGLKMLAI